MFSLTRENPNWLGKHDYKNIAAMETSRSVNIDISYQIINSKVGGFYFDIYFWILIYYYYYYLLLLLFIIYFKIMDYNN